MTLEGLIFMKYKHFKFAFLCCSILYIGNVNAAHIFHTARMDVMVKVKVPTCTLTVPSEINLGSLPPQMTTYGSLTVEYSCSANIPTRILATMVNVKPGDPLVGLAGDDLKVEMKYWVPSDGKFISLDGNDAFCRGNGSGNCLVGIEASPKFGAKAGGLNTSLSLSIAYN